MAEPCIISVAITGSVARKKDNPTVPISVAEQIESTQAAYEAGAALVHVHVRDAQENPSSDPARFAAFQEGIRKHCPDIIVQFSTGGRGRALDQRGSMLANGVKPEVEVFDLAMLYNAAGTGRHQLDVNHWALEMGGHCRTGLEDNIRWDKATLAASNAQLITRVAALCAQYGRPVATPKQARDILHLRPAA